MSSVNNQKNEIEHCEINISPASGSVHQMAPPAPFGKMPFNPTPIGFGAFACCAFVLGLYNTRLITALPTTAVGVALGYGAIGQFVCGVCEIFAGSAFGATTMFTYSSFFLSYGIMLVPSSGIYEFVVGQEGPQAIRTCLGLVEIGFCIPSFIFFIGTLRQPKIIRVVIFLVFLVLLTGGIGGLTGIAKVSIASGYICFILSILAWYVMAATLYTPEITMVKLPIV